MLAAQHIKEDLTRFRSLHSYYKYPKDCKVNIYPLLNFGQQPYQPICPDINPEYDMELRWWFLIDPELEEFQSVFGKDTKFIWNKSHEFASEIKINSLGSFSDGPLIDEVTKNALKFHEATKDIYEKIQERKQQLCPKCAQPFFCKFGCFGSTCNRFSMLVHSFKGNLTITESKKVLCENKDDKDLLAFVMYRFKSFDASLKIYSIGKFNLEQNPLRLRIFYVSKRWHVCVEHDDIGSKILFASTHSLNRT